ncbi:MAG: hypothetical protein OXE76_03990 [Alphaproteobacteria bacterium]|nr:hypothetical protein [Alphaproteobacteria bacterium]
MPLKLAGANRALNDADGGLLAGTRYIGLIDGSDDEVSGNNYAREAITGFGNTGGWVADGREYENRLDVEFNDPEGGAWPAIEKWGLWDAATGGNFLADVTLATPTAAPQIGAAVGAAMMQLAYGFTGVTPAGALAMMREGLFRGTRAWTLHTDLAASASAVANPERNAIFFDNTKYDGTNAGGRTLITASVSNAQITLSTRNNTTRRASNNADLSFGQLNTSAIDRPRRLALRDGTQADSAVLWTGDFGSTPEVPGLGSTLRLLTGQINFDLPFELVT